MSEAHTTGGPQAVGDLDDDRQVFVRTRGGGGGSNRRVHLYPGAETESDETCRYADRAGARPVAARTLWDHQQICETCQRMEADDE